VSSEELSCAQRIDDQLAGREESLQNIFKDTDSDDYEENENGWEALHEYALGYEKKDMLKIELSTGGPGDWLECYLSDNKVYRVEYHFNDWFDHAQTVVDEDSYVFRYAEYIVEGIYFN